MEIMPITEMRNTNKISEICLRTGKPVFITRNGVGHLVIQSHESFAKEQEELMMYRELMKSEKIQIENGDKTKKIKEVIERLNKEYDL